MRPWAAAVAAVVLLVAGCSQARQAVPTPPGSTAAGHINPGNIKRVGRDLPPGYEVKPVSGVIAPATIWGLGAGRRATPARCAVLADPAGGNPQSAQGISGSGAGGIVYALVAAAPVALDQSLLTPCREWTVTDGHATARVHLVDAPPIDGAQTLGLAAKISTSVEGGNEIDSEANTFTAYLGDYYAFTTLITDPGSSQSALPPRFAAGLLVKAVFALRA